MDRISGLPDELLVKILTFAETKVAVSTSVLSKRWKCLWMWLPKLEFDYTTCRIYDPGPALLLFGIAVSRYVRELQVSYYSDRESVSLSSLRSCESLVVLKLEYMTLVDVPSMVCLPSLKTLELHSVTYVDEDCLQQLISICPVLEDLSVRFRGHDSMKEFAVVVPSLQSLSLRKPDYWRVDGYVIDTPCLRYFKLEDWNYSGHYTEIKNMPNLREAYVDVVSSNLKSVVGSVCTSVQRLTICSEEDDYGDGFVFKELEHLKICLCNKNSSNLLARLLKDSPNLRVLEISYMKAHGDDECNDMVPWNQPSHVPECLLSSVQDFKWSGYFGRPQERDIAVYMLKNARRLKTVTILADTRERFVTNLCMIKELTLSSRASSSCELVFVEGHHLVSEEE